MSGQCGDKTEDSLEIRSLVICFEFENLTKYFLDIILAPAMA